LLKLEPSAHIPWQKTMLGLVFISSLRSFGVHCCSCLRFSPLMRGALAFLHHPLFDIGRGVQNRYSPRLARIQEMNGLNINKFDFLQVQNAS